MAETRDSSFSRDLLQRFICGGGGTHFPEKSTETVDRGRTEKVELSLGLSLNGRFGVEPQRVVVNDNTNNNKLFRASSAVDLMNFPADVELTLNSPLTRTCSLLTETELRSRRELQSLRRSEVKRKREEKMRNVRVVKGKTGEEVELLLVGLKESPPPRPPALPEMQFSSHGSIVTQGSGGSSGVSEFESQPVAGINKEPEVKSVTRDHTRSNQVPSKTISGFNRARKVDTPIGPSTKNSVETSSQPSNAHCPSHETPTDMPFVSTKGDGPNGKKIQGFLYRYRKGEEVRIVCVCHGSFLTPAEFVKHGGGGDVEHPLRHIIVNSKDNCL